MKNADFNNNEQKVLKALYNNMLDCTGGDFGYMDEVDRTGFTKHQFAGYISALKEKKVFDFLDTEGFKTNGMMVYGQFALNDEAKKLAETL